MIFCFCFSLIFLFNKYTDIIHEKINVNKLISKLKHIYNVLVKLLQIYSFYYLLLFYKYFLLYIIYMGQDNSTLKYNDNEINTIQSNKNLTTSPIIKKTDRIPVTARPPIKSISTLKATKRRLPLDSSTEISLAKPSKKIKTSPRTSPITPPITPPMTLPITPPTLPPTKPQLQTYPIDKIKTKKYIPNNIITPLSEVLIIGFYIDMIHDFCESSDFTGSYKVDKNFFVNSYDAVFSESWPECREVLQLFNIYIEKETKINPDDISSKARSNWSKFIHKAHEIYYNLIINQGKSIELNWKENPNDCMKWTGGGRGLPNYYMFGEIVHKKTGNYMSILNNYESITNNTSQQNDLITTIEMLNLGSIPDESGPMGQFILKDKTGKKESDTKNILIIEDATQSKAQLLQSFALNFKYVNTLGLDNDFNLVAIKTTPGFYDEASEKFKQPPLNNITVSQRDIDNLNCYDYYKEKFNFIFTPFPTFNDISLTSKNLQDNYKKINNNIFNVNNKIIEFSIEPKIGSFKPFQEIMSQFIIGLQLFFSKINDKENDDICKDIILNSKFIDKFDCTKIIDISVKFKSIINTWEKHYIEIIHSFFDKNPFKEPIKNNYIVDNCKNNFNNLFNNITNSFIANSNIRNNNTISNLLNTNSNIINLEYDYYGLANGSEHICSELTNQVSKYIENIIEKITINENKNLTENMLINNFINILLSILNKQTLSKEENISDIKTLISFILCKKPIGCTSKNLTTSQKGILNLFNNDEIKESRLVLIIINWYIFYLSLSCFENKDTNNVIRPFIETTTYYAETPIISNTISEILIKNNNNIITSKKQKKIKLNKEKENNDDNSDTKMKIISGGAKIAKDYKVKKPPTKTGIITKPKLKTEVGKKIKKLPILQNEINFDNIPISPTASVTNIQKTFRTLFIDDTSPSNKELFKKAIIDSGNRSSNISKDLIEYLSGKNGVITKLNDDYNSNNSDIKEKARRKLIVCFGVKLEKTMGDFSQGKLAQYLTNIVSCHTLINNEEKEKFIPWYKEYIHMIPYSHNYKLQEINSIFYNFLNNQNNKPKTSLAYNVNLITFDIQCGLITAQQGGNSCLQTLTGNGSVCYSISNLSPNIRKYFDDIFDLEEENDDILTNTQISIPINLLYEIKKKPEINIKEFVDFYKDIESILSGALKINFSNKNKSNILLERYNTVFSSPSISSANKNNYKLVKAIIGAYRNSMAYQNDSNISLPVSIIKVYEYNKLNNQDAINILLDLAETQMINPIPIIPSIQTGGKKTKKNIKCKKHTKNKKCKINKNKTRSKNKINKKTRSK